MTFDPNKPFDLIDAPAPEGSPVADAAASGGGGGFDPSKPFEVVETGPARSILPIRRQIGKGGTPIFDRNLDEGFSNTVVGEAVNRNRSGEVQLRTGADALRAADEAEAAGSPVGLNSWADGTPSPLTGMPVGELRKIGNEAQVAGSGRAYAYDARDQARQALEKANPIEGVGGAGSALVGQLLGAAGSPENLVGGVAGGARAVGERALGYMARRFGKGAGENVAAQAIADPVVQGSQVGRGEKEDYDPTQTAVSTALAGVLGGGLNVAPAAIKMLAGRVREALAARHGVAPEALTPDHLSPEAISGALADDPNLGRILEANGISDANDPAHAGTIQKLIAARDARAAGRPEQPLTTTAAGRQGEAEIAAAETAQRKIAAETPNELTPEQIVEARARGEPVLGGGQPAETIPVQAPLTTADHASGGPLARQGLAGEADAGTQAGIDRTRAPQAQPDRVRKSALTDDQAGLIAREFDMTPEDVHGMTPKAQTTLLEKASAQAVRQADQNAAGPMHVTDTSGEGPTNAASRPQQATDIQQDGTKGGRYRGDREQPLPGAHDQTGAGTSDRPFRANDTSGLTPDQARANEERVRGQAADARKATQDDLERQWQERARAREGSPHPDAEAQRVYEGGKNFSNKAGAQDAEGRFGTDKYGFVVSDKGGPVIFGDQKMAAKWIVNQGHKLSPDQVFEIENHPSGKGFTVRERERTQQSGAGGDRANPSEAPSTGTVGTQRPPAPEAKPVPELAPRPPEPPRPDATPPAPEPKPTPHVEPAPAEPPRPKAELPRTDHVGGRTSEVVTPQGRKVPVEDVVVEARDLRTSDHADYPSELQPRDRSRAASQQQVTEIAGNLDPERLHHSREATTGAPIVGKDHNVESGNGRVMSIREAYRQGGDSAERYRQMLRDQGHNIDGMSEPVLVRRRTDDPTPDDRRAFTREANERDTLGMSATERAHTDASALGDKTMNLYYGGDINSASNRQFVRRFIEEAVSPGDRASMMGPDGKLSQDGARRINAGILNKTYDNADVVRALVEDTDAGIKGIGDALMDVAGKWSAMRDKMKAGNVDPALDITPHLMDAVSMVRRARAEGIHIGDLLNQMDIEKGTVDPVTEALVKSMYNDEGLKRASGRAKIADRLGEYAKAAEREGAPSLEGGKTPEPRDLVERSRNKADGTEGQGGFGFDQPSARAAGKDAAPGGAAEQRPQPEKDRGRPGGKDGVAPEHPQTAEELGKLNDEFTNKLYSNPIADPELWKLVGRAAGRAVDNVLAPFKSLAEALKGSTALSTPKLFKDGVARYVEAFFGSKAGELLTIHEQTGSKAVKELHDMLFALAGGRDDTGRTFGAAVQQKSKGWVNQVIRAMEPFDKLSKAEKTKALEQLGQMVTTGGKLSDTEMGRAAGKLRDVLDEIHAYAKEAGIDLGHVKGYYPRVYDHEKILAQREGFVKAATEALQHPLADGTKGLSAAEAKKAAENWVRRIEKTEFGLSPNGNTEFAQLNRGASRGAATKERVLGAKADTILKDFMVRNPADALPAYIASMVKRAEFVRRMGADLEHWERLKNDMLDQGVGKRIGDVTDIVTRAFGMVAPPSGLGGAVTGALRTASSLTFLAKTAFLQVSEPAMLAVRTGDVTKMFSGYVETAKAAFNSAKQAENRIKAESLGLIERGLSDMATERVMSGHSSMLVEKFYRGIGLQSMTNWQRQAAMVMGERYIHQLTQELGTSVDKSAKRFLTQLGISEAEHGDFAKWVNDRGGAVTWEHLAKDEGHAATYATAVTRFVNQTILSVDRSMRPRYAEHPLGSLLYAITGYASAFHKNVINRVLPLAKDALTEGDLSARDRLRMLAPAMALAAVWAPMSYGVWEARNQLYTDPSKPKKEPKEVSGWAERVVNASSMLGMAQMPYNWLVPGVKYLRDPSTAMLGPELGTLAESFGNIIKLASDKNSTGTNAVERSAVDSAYKTIAFPLAMAAIVSSPLPVPVQMGAAYALSHPAVKGAAVEAIAGKPEGAGNAVGRGGGRSGGRGGGRSAGR